MRINSEDPQADHHFIYLVTAKHVAQGTQGEAIWIRANTKDGSTPGSSALNVSIANRIPKGQGVGDIGEMVREGP